MGGIASWWKKMWRIKVPERTKINAWKAINDALPTGLNLRRRGCKGELKCAFCDFKGETFKHILVDCWYARCIWEGLDMRRNESNNMLSFREWFWGWFNNLERKEKVSLLIGMWVICQSRNLLSHNKGGWEVDKSILKVKSLVDQFGRKALAGATELEEFEEDDTLIFCDGSWQKESKKAGFGLVVMKNDVKMYCKADFAVNCTSVEHAELRAVLEGLRLAHHLRLEKAVACSDNVAAVWAFLHGRISFEEELNWVREGMEIIRGKQGWRITHIFRESNALADGLAIRASSLEWSWS